MPAGSSSSADTQKYGASPVLSANGDQQRRASCAALLIAVGGKNGTGTVFLRVSERGGWLGKDLASEEMRISK